MEMEGYQVTRPLRAIGDLLRSRDVHPGILREALQEGMDNGLITIGEIRRAREAGLLAELGEETL
jgi:hypothetical protein